MARVGCGAPALGCRDGESAACWMNKPWLGGSVASSARWARLSTAFDSLEPDAQRILVLLAERAAKGRRDYGGMTLATDPRNMHREAAEEAIDGLFYAAAALLKGGETMAKASKGKGKKMPKGMPKGMKKGC